MIATTMWVSIMIIQPPFHFLYGAIRILSVLFMNGLYLFSKQQVSGLYFWYE